MLVKNLKEFPKRDKDADLIIADCPDDIDFVDWEYKILKAKGYNEARKEIGNLSIDDTEYTC